MQKIYTSKIILLSFIVSLFNTLNAQTHDHYHDHGQHENHHEHPANEIGIGNFLSYHIGDQEFAYGLHLHYLRAIKDSKFGYGLGYEQVFDEHNHKTVGIIGSYRPLPNLVISLSPGILFPNTESPHSRFIAHSEVVYEFEIRKLHLGPTVEFATSFEEHHLGAGIHLGYAF